MTPSLGHKITHVFSSFTSPDARAAAHAASRLSRHGQTDHQGDGQQSFDQRTAEYRTIPGNPRQGPQADANPFGDHHAADTLSTNGLSEFEDTSADNSHRQHHSPTSPLRPPQSDQSAPIPVQTNAEEQLNRITRQIQQAAEETTMSKIIAQSRKNYGVESALELLLGFYQQALSDINENIRKAAMKIGNGKALNALLAKNDASAAVELLVLFQQEATSEKDLLEDRIQKAVKGIVGEREFNALSANRGTEDILERLVEYSKQGFSAKEKLNRVNNQIRGASRNLSQRDLEYAYNNKGGVEGTLSLLISDYQEKTFSAAQLKQVVDQIRAVLHKMPGKKRELDAVLYKEGPEGALKLLLQCYHAYAEAHQELIRVEVELMKAAHGLLSANDLEGARKEKGIEGVFKLLVSRLQSNVKELDTNVGELHKTLNTVISQNQKLESENSDLKDKLKSREANYRSDLERRETALQLAREKHEDEIDRMREEYEKKLEEARQAEKTRTEVLRQKNEALKGVLVARQHIKGLSDPEICESFKKLASEVDNFSRLQWEMRKESRWPFPENSLRRSENPRKLRQHIVQSSIWVILNEKIFRSPFEVFGQEGRRMHSDWTQSFGQGTKAFIPF